MQSIKFNKVLLIEDNKTRVATSLPTLTAGEIGVFDSNGTLLNSTTVVGKPSIKIVTGSVANGTAQGLGLVLDAVDVQSGTISAVVYKAQTQSLSYVGYNGTSGSLDVINDNPYQVFVKDLDSRIYGSTGQTYSGYYKSDSNATQQEVADGLGVNLAANIRQTTPLFASAQRITSGTKTTVPTGAGTLTFTKGSNSVSFSTNIADATGTAALVVGDYLSVATGVTVAVYKVTAINTTTNIATLDQAFNGTTATVVNATARFLRVADAAAAANWGIEILGQVQPFASVNLAASQEFYVSKFYVSTGGFTNTLVTASTFASKGSGEPADVAVLERSLISQQGFQNHNTWPPAVFPNQTDISAASGYSLISIVYTKKGGPDLLTQPAVRNELLIAAKQISAPVNTTTPPQVISQAGGVVLSTGMLGTTGVINVLSAWLGVPIVLSYGG